MKRDSKSTILDDGALRFVRPNGEPVDRVTARMPSAAWRSERAAGGKVGDCWRGDRMDMDLAVDLLIQKSQKARDVPAGT